VRIQQAPFRLLPPERQAQRPAHAAAAKTAEVDDLSARRDACSSAKTVANVTRQVEEIGRDTGDWSQLPVMLPVSQVADVGKRYASCMPYAAPRQKVENGLPAGSAAPCVLRRHVALSGAPMPLRRCHMA